MDLTYTYRGNQLTSSAGDSLRVEFDLHGECWVADAGAQVAEFSDAGEAFDWAKRWLHQRHTEGRVGKAQAELDAYLATDADIVTEEADDNG